MTLVAPRPQGITLPGISSRSTEPRSADTGAPGPSSSPSPGTVGLAAGGAQPAIAADPDAFRQHLIAVVESEMGKLTEARAVDEWHREVLDPRIAAEVDQESRRIERAASERLTALKGQQAATRAQLERFEVLERESDEVMTSARSEVSVTQAQVQARATGAPTGDRGSGGLPRPDAQGQLAAIRVQLERHREGIQRALRGAGVKSEQELGSALQTAQRKSADLDRQVADGHRLVAQAEAARVAAHDRFRGSSSQVDDPGTVRAEPSVDEPALGLSGLADPGASDSIAEQAR